MSTESPLPEAKRIRRAGRAYWLYDDGTILPVISGGDGTTTAEPESPFLEQLLNQRDTNQSRMDEILDAVTREERNALSTEEDEDYRRLDEENRGLDERIAELHDAETRRAAAAEAAGAIEGRGNDGRTRVRREPLTYERHNRTRSFFLDLARRVQGGDPGAIDRLNRHAQEMRVEMRLPDALRRAEFQRFLSGEDASAEARDLTGADGSGGDFVPPIWLMEEYAALARAGRPFADVCRRIPLPAGTDSINVPRIATGTAVQPQAALNDPVHETDATTAVVNAPVRTLAGQQDIPLQLLEQSPISFDEIVFADLVADYNMRVDAQVIAGPGTNGTLKGVLNASGITTVTYTDATPTMPELWPKLADAVQQAGTNRKLPPTLMAMHLRRWAWESAALDTTGRPLVVPIAPVNQGPNNAAAVLTNLETGGIVGGQHGVATMVDLNIPINLGAGTNEDRIIVCRPSDFLLFEGQLRSRALMEVLSGTLQVRLQVYAYAAFTAERYPSGIAVVAGTGLITPTF